MRGRGRIFKKEGLTPLLDTSNKSERLGAKPPRVRAREFERRSLYRVGGWEEEDKLKTGGWGEYHRETKHDNLCHQSI